MIQKVKLIVGIISALHDDEPVIMQLEKLFGVIDAKSALVEFNFTQYYRNEMGDALMRYWLSFEDLISHDALSEVKNKTSEVEKSFSENAKRRVNIDPGYLAPSKLILASKKDFSHRIYLRESIFAEVTLLYEKNGFRVLPWTYPDYKSETFLKFITRCRNILLEQLSVTGHWLK